MSPYTLPAIVVVTLATVVIGAYGPRLARTTSDFLVASRMVSPTWNAAAVLVTVLGPPLHGWAATVVQQPAAWVAVCG